MNTRTPTGAWDSVPSEPNLTQATRRIQNVTCALLLAAATLPLGASSADSVTIVPPGLYTNAAQRRLWKPVADDVYLQEVGGQVRTAQPVTALAPYQGTLYAVTGGKLKMLSQQALQDLPGAPAGIRRLRSLGRALWASAEGGNYRFASDKWQRIDEKAMVDFCLHLGQVHAATAVTGCAVRTWPPISWR